jgi:hypothetical protein
MENRNEIKKRMVSSAAKSWGLSIRDMETVDPLVTLLIDASANEMEKISASIDEAGRKMAMKLTEQLIPESLLSPVPARAIMHAIPFETVVRVNEDHEFYYFKKNPYEDEEEDLQISFTPVAGHRLYNGKVDFIASGNALYRLDELNEKSLLLKSRSGKDLSDSIWLGLNLHKSINSLEGLSFYFVTDNMNDIQEKVFYQALKSSKWEINDIPIKAMPGYFSEPGTGGKKQIKLPLADFNRSFAVSRQVLDFYRKHFISFGNNPWSSILNQDTFMKYPSHFPDIFNPDELKAFNNRLLWIKVSFLPHIPRNLLDQVLCSINCFPVINRRKEKSVIMGFDRIKELRIQPNEVFFDLKEVSCDENLEVVIGNENTEDLEGKALLTLRKDNIGRFNTSNAVDQIHQMIEAYRNEYSAFSKIEGIEIDTVDKLNEAIRPFEIAIDNIRNYMAGSKPYMMLKTEAGKESVEVDVSYYLSCGSLGNGINKGMHMNYDSAELTREKIFLMTTTMGGTDIKKDEELIRNFRYALLTQGKIVTFEDIKALCAVHFGKHADSIDVKKGVAMDTLYNSGLQRIIEIMIHLRPESNLSPEEIKFLREDLEQQLVERSTNVLPFRIVFS